jgi:hypothetical protein
VTKRGSVRVAARAVARAVVVAVAVAAGMAGCARRVDTAGRAGAAEGPAPAEYYPLAVGNRWTYDVNFLGERREHTVELVGRRQDGFFLDRDGGAIGLDGFGLGDGQRYLLRPPLVPGRDWSVVLSVSSVERYRVLSVGEPCSAPAGSFPDCVVVEGRNRVDPRTTLVNTLTFARGVGIVRVETVAEAGEKRVPQSTRVLTSYALQTQG